MYDNKMSMTSMSTGYLCKVRAFHPDIVRLFWFLGRVRLPCLGVFQRYSLILVTVPLTRLGCLRIDVLYPCVPNGPSEDNPNRRGAPTKFIQISRDCIRKYQ